MHLLVIRAQYDQAFDIIDSALFNGNTDKARNTLSVFETFSCIDKCLNQAILWPHQLNIMFIEMQIKRYKY